MMDSILECQRLSILYQSTLGWNLYDLLVHCGWLWASGSSMRKSNGLTLETVFVLSDLQGTICPSVP